MLQHPSRRRNPGAKSMKISVVGIGVMGEPIARNLKKAGLDVTVHSRTLAACDAHKEIGIVVAGTAAEAIAASDVIILMLPGHQEIDQVLGRDANGKVHARLDGKTLIVMATVAPAYSHALENAVTAAGARYVEAPVSGSKTPAQTGQLVILASAADETYIDAVQAAFDAIGKKTLRCGVVPSAMRMKLAVLTGPLANDVLRMKAPKLLADDFAQQAAIRNVFKDISLVCEEAGQRDVWLPIALANRDLFGEAMRCGQSNDDAIAIVKVLRGGKSA
jgi:3-hydroxyisobutyrate dehydrogenase